MSRRQGQSEAPAGAPSNPKEIEWEPASEFGGSLGTLLIMILSPLTVYYLWICVHFYGGQMALPAGLVDVSPFLQRMWQHVAEGATPTWYETKMYGLFCLFEAVLAYVMPGPVVKGLPIPSEGGRQLDYICNGVWCWYATLVMAVVLHVTQIFPLTDIVDHFGPLLTVAIVAGNLVSILTYLYGILSGTAIRMSGSFTYDLFMGAPLNPRIGRLDLKMWAEIRVPWTLLFFISLSVAVKQYEVYGSISPSVLFLVLAHFLYANACMKGEECIPTTWDIFYEKWGYMLIFWNLAGVPFNYCMGSLYLSTLPPTALPPFLPLLALPILLAAYYVWDTANSQKNFFRMARRGTYIPRSTFPQLPWKFIHNPRYLKTEAGSELLIDGWYRYARKIHYTADLVMALLWGVVCGTGSFVPYFYFCFFLLVLTHRVGRDMERCKAKYGKDWERYCNIVPYVFIPGIY